MAKLRGTSGLTQKGLITSTTAPSGGLIGQLWYKPETGVTYQWTNDGASSFWLDISSGGIGTSADRGVDFVGDTDPHLETNLGVVGSVYYNREKNKHFVCTTATTNSNVWSGRFAGAGGVETTYKSGSTFYRVHTFLSSGTLITDGTITADYLVIGGGGGGGSADGGGAGAGAIKYRTGHAISIGTYAVTVGAGGIGSPTDNTIATAGGASSIGALISSPGGGIGEYGSSRAGGAGGSGGGGAGGGGSSAAGVGSGDPSGTNNAVNFVNGWGNNGGSTSGQSSGYGGGGGGGAGTLGDNQGNSGTPGFGGNGLAYNIRNGTTNVVYATGGGGASRLGSHSGTDGAGGSSNIHGNQGGVTQLHGGSAPANTGSGGGGGSESNKSGGNLSLIHI